MFITKENRLRVYMYLFKEGTLVAKKDFYQPAHSETLPVHNLEVLCLMRSLKSRGFVIETFSWRHYYYVITPEGIDYLRQELALPAEVIPATYARSERYGSLDNRKITDNRDYQWRNARNPQNAKNHEQDPSYGKAQYKSSSKNFTPGTSQLDAIRAAQERDEGRRETKAATRHKIGNGRRSEK